MPQMSTIISGAASLGVLAGVVSGIFYLVLSGIRWAGRIRAALQEEEARQDKCVSCGRRLGGREPSSAPVVCTRCGRTACFGAPCSRPAAIGWNCIVCHVRREMESSSGSWTDVKSEEEMSLQSEKGPRNVDSETFQVREFIEKLVEKLVGGPLDGVSVGKLSSHPAYNGMFSKYHEPLCQALARLGFALHFSIANKVPGKAEDTPSSAHSALSQLIERIALDAESMPNLTRVHSPTANGINSAGTNGKSYEDILSTAVLNKVIDNFQRNNGYYTDQDDERSFARSSSSFIDDDNNSLDDRSTNHSRSEGSEPIALKIEEHIEEVTTAYESSCDGNEEEDDLEEYHNNHASNRRVPFPEFGVDLVDGNAQAEVSDPDSDSCATDVISNHSTWEENWLFQRKKLKSARNSHHPVPVPMLVPNPSQEFRALIGGVDADDISDLSECSDSVLEETMSDTFDDSTKVLEIIDILNQEPSTYDDLDSNNTTESMSRLDENPTYSSEVPITMQSEDLCSSDTQITTPDSLEVEDDASILDESPSPSPSLVQQDRDFPVDYDQIARIDGPPIPKPRTLDVQVSENFSKEQPPVCPIAQREKAKWNNAIEMKDNPYTSENIAKRNQNKSTYFSRSNAINHSIDFPTELETLDVPESPPRRYTRDYFVKSSKAPTGEHSTRFTDSPVSVRSEASLEEGGSSHHIESWSNLTPIPQVRKEAKNLSETTESRKEVAQHFGLPSVKELKKSFSSEQSLVTKPPVPPRSTQNARESQTSEKRESAARRISDQSVAKELELDYSVIPVSEIITNLTEKSNKVLEAKDQQQEIFREVSEIRRGRRSTVESSQAVDKEVLRRDSSSIDDGFSEELNPKDSLMTSKLAMKPVHSLTARSIPKDFREGLKRSNAHVLRGQLAVPTKEANASAQSINVAPLNIDLKRRKQFWEEVIAKESIKK